MYFLSNISLKFVISSSVTNHVCSITLKPFKVFSSNFIQILTNIRRHAECKKNRTLVLIFFELRPFELCKMQFWVQDGNILNSSLELNGWYYLNLVYNTASWSSIWVLLFVEVMTLSWPFVWEKAGTVDFSKTEEDEQKGYLLATFTEYVWPHENRWVLKVKVRSLKLGIQHQILKHC